MITAGAPRQAGATFFFDACISPKLVQILSLVQSEDALVHMFDVDGFGRDDDDIVWIPKVAKLGHVLVTSDNAQRRKVVEVVLRESVKIRTVFFPGGFAQLGRWMQARWVINHWETIANETRTCREGESYLIAMNGKVAREQQRKKR